MMECEYAVELFPWFLNRTLEATEREEVEAHLKACENCRRKLQETAFIAAAARQHVPTEVLVDYGFDRPIALDRHLVERHLESCSRCAEELDMVQESHRLARKNGEVAGFASRPTVPRVWRSGTLAASIAALVAVGGWWWSSQDVQRLRSALESVDRGQSPPREDRTNPSDSEEVYQQLAVAQAEGEELRLSVSRIEDELAQERAKNTGLEERVAALEGPQLNGWVEDVFPLGPTRISRHGMPPMAMRRSSEAMNEIKRRPGATRLELNLSAALETTYPDYEVDLVEASGLRLWQGTGLELLPEGYFHLKLPVDLLPEIAFEIRVYGLKAGERTEAARYPILIRPDD